LQAKMHNILGLNNALKENTSRKVTVILPETETVSIKEKFLQKRFHTFTQIFRIHNFPSSPLAATCV